MNNLKSRILVFTLVGAGASQSTYTIDDSSNAVTYNGNWITQDGNGFAQPDHSLVYDGTWHDSTRDVAPSPPVSFDITFSGSGITLYCILFSTPYPEDGTGRVTAITNLSFSLDNNPSTPSYVSTYRQTASYTYYYNTIVYDNQQIPNGTHVLTALVQPDSVVLFDYANVYLLGAPTPTPPVSTPPVSTSPTPSQAPAPAQSPTSHSSGVSAAAIGGGVGAGVFGFLCLCAALYFFLAARRKRHNEAPGRQQSEVDLEDDAGSLPSPTHFPNSPSTTEANFNPAHISMPPAYTDAVGSSTRLARRETKRAET